MNPLEYKLAEILMFSSDTYYRMIALYNQSLWPFHILAFLAGLLLLALCFSKSSYQSRLTALLLTSTWLWVGYGYLLNEYAIINWYATLYSAPYFLQALLFVWFGLIRNRFHIQITSSIRSGIAIFLLIYALAIHPILTAATLGLANTELFGLLPTPTLIATLGILLLTTNAPRTALLIIPLLSAIVGGSTAWELGTWEALSGLIAAIITIPALFLKK